MADNTDKIVDQLSNEISADVGNQHEDELSAISSTFDKTLNNALKVFKSSTFDNDGFIKKMRNLDVDKKDKDMVKNVLNTLKSEYVDVSGINQSELLLRKDMYNICTQMPEMRDVIYVIRDAIIECNVSTGEVSRNITFENHQDNGSYEAQAKEIESRHDLLMAIKNFIVPKALMAGEMYIHVLPYAKLFAELEAIKELKQSGNSIGAVRQGYKESGSIRKRSKGDCMKTFRESVPSNVLEQFTESVSIYNETNLKSIMESVAPITKIEASDVYKISETAVGGTAPNATPDAVNKTEIKALLENIHVCKGSSVLMEEMGVDGLRDFLYNDYKANTPRRGVTKETHFVEAMSGSNGIGGSIFSDIDDDDIQLKTYSHIKGCYIKYLDGLKMAPIRMDRKVIGYYYVTTTSDLTTTPNQARGIVDLSFENYTKDKTLVDNLANMIIKSFDKKMLERNIKLKGEIAEVIMAHKFSEGRISFIYIPENEVVRLVINEDENGRGHGVIEPTLFPARMYLMLNLYNMIYTLNNNTTRIHYLRSSGMNKDYAAQIQRTMRKFQSRRITVDDLYSYSGALNKVGGIGEMILPAGRGDYKALETDSIEAVNNPINIEFLEQQRRQAISGTGVPHLLVINAIDEVDFAKTLEMANTRFLSTVCSYKIDFNRGITKLYQLIMKYSTDLDDDVIQSFRFQFNAIKQQELNITADMVTNFNAMFELVSSVYYSKEDMEDEKGAPTPKQKHLKRELAKEYLPQLDFDRLDEVVKRVNVAAGDDVLQNRVSKVSITDQDLDEITKK